MFCRNCIAKIAIRKLQAIEGSIRRPSGGTERKCLQNLRIFYADWSQNGRKKQKRAAVEALPDIEHVPTRMCPKSKAPTAKQ